MSGSERVNVGGWLLVAGLLGACGSSAPKPPPDDWVIVFDGAGGVMSAFKGCESSRHYETGRYVTTCTVEAGR